MSYNYIYNYFVGYMYEKDNKRCFGNVTFSTEIKINGYYGKEILERDLKKQFDISEITILSICLLDTEQKLRTSY